MRTFVAISVSGILLVLLACTAGTGSSPTSQRIFLTRTGATVSTAQGAGAATVSPAGTPPAVTITPASVVSVSLSPEKVGIRGGRTQEFKAEVKGPADTSVTWSIEGEGSISNTGVYTAPKKRGIYYVIATSRADPSRTARASVSVVPNSVMVMFPPQVTLLPGARQEFRAALIGSDDTRMLWLPNPSNPTNAVFQSTGSPFVYTAPFAPGAYELAARSETDPETSARARVTVVRGVWILTGRAETTAKGGFGSGNGVIFATGSATVTHGEAALASSWRCTWPEPPAVINPGDKISGTLGVGDAGSFNTLQDRYSWFGVANIVNQWDSPEPSTSSNLTGSAQTPSASRSIQLVGPGGNLSSPRASRWTLSFNCQAQLGREGTASTWFTATVTYSYELRMPGGPAPALPAPGATPRPLPTKPEVRVEFTYPAGESPRVFTDGWVLGAKATLSLPDGKVLDLSDTVAWTGEATFSPPKGSRTRPAFNLASRLDEGPRKVTIAVEYQGERATASLVFETVNPRRGYARVGDQVFGIVSHGDPGSPWSPTGGIVSGSPTVLIGDLPAARVADIGWLAPTTGAGVFEIREGDSEVLIDGQPAARKRDGVILDCTPSYSDDKGCGGMGNIVSVASETLP